MNRLINPIVNWTSIKSAIARSQEATSPSANDFTSFLQSYIARWAVRAGIP
jgi:hypothetical protein